MILNGILPEECQDVVTRKDASGPWGDVKNLKWAKRGQPIRQSHEAKRLALIKAVLGEDIPSLDDGYRLSAPCKKSHLWNGLQLGIQKKVGSQWRCAECIRLNDLAPERKAWRSAYLDANRERLNEDARKRMARLRSNEEYRALSNERNARSQARRRVLKGRESRAKGAVGQIVPVVPGVKGTDAFVVRAIMARGHEMENAIQVLPEYKRLWDTLKTQRPCWSVTDLVAQEQRRYWDENPEARLLVERERRRSYAKWRHLTDPEYRLYHRQKSKRRKAMMRDSVAVQVEAKQLRARFAQFDHCCAYCGVSGEDLHIEHVVPISKGGPHALGNIIPACQRCNFSKRDHDAEIWYRRQEFYSEVRWRKICRVLGWSKSAVGQLALL